MNYAQNDAGLLTHYRASQVYRGIIEKVSAGSGVEQSIIWAIGSKETGWGTSSLLKPKGPTGTGDHSKRVNGRNAAPDGLPADKLGWGRGLMQIDYAWHDFAQTGNWRDPEANIRYAIEAVFLSALTYLKKRCADRPADVLTRAAISAYNCGAYVATDALRKGTDPDKFTTHGNYAADVVARGNWFEDGGGWNR